MNIEIKCWLNISMNLSLQRFVLNWIYSFMIFVNEFIIILLLKKDKELRMNLRLLKEKDFRFIIDDKLWLKMSKWW